MVFTSILNWLRLRQYQYSVTMVGYMMTPWERFVFESGVLFLLIMIITATVFYFPEHLSMIARRATFYFFGHDQHAPEVYVVGKDEL